MSSKYADHLFCHTCAGVKKAAAAAKSGEQINPMSAVKL